jgi:lysophospholipase L1-like esterase
VGCGFFDLSEAMGGTESMQEWMAQGWMKSDGIHFHSAGYQHIAYQIFTEIERAFLTDKKARNSTER